MCRYIRLRASQMEGFDANSFNMRFNEDTKKYQCFVYFATIVQAKQASEIFKGIKIHDCQLKSKYREPAKQKNEIKLVKVGSYHIISVDLKYKLIKM